MLIDPRLHSQVRPQDTPQAQKHRPIIQFPKHNKQLKRHPETPQYRLKHILRHQQSNIPSLHNNPIQIPKKQTLPQVPRLHPLFHNYFLLYILRPLRVHPSSPTIPRLRTHPLMSRAPGNLDYQSLFHQCSGTQIDFPAGGSAQHFLSAVQGKEDRAAHEVEIFGVAGVEVEAGGPG
jgi:hypothetical protein